MSSDPQRAAGSNYIMFLLSTPPLFAGRRIQPLLIVDGLVGEEEEQGTDPALVPN